MVLFTFVFMCKRFFLKNLCDQESRGKFPWQNLKQMLCCFDFFPVAFLAIWGKRN